MATKYLTNRDDRFHGTNKGDLIYALKGSDEVYGGKGNDVIYGQGGFDRLYGEGGNDTIYGGDGNDWLYSNDGSHDILNGGNGSDNFQLNNSDAFGGGGNDYLLAVSSYDDGGPATVTRLDGGIGKDKFEIHLDRDETHDITIVQDFNREDQWLVLWSSDEKEYINIEQGTIYSAESAHVAYIGHDVVLTANGTDQDQVIIRGGADWLHAA